MCSCFQSRWTPAFHRFVNTLRPGASAQLPGCTKLKDTLLKEAVEEAEKSPDDEISTAISNGHKPGMATDGWSNVRKQHVDGIMITLGSTVVVLGQARGGSIHHAIAVAMGWEELLFKTYGQYEFAYFCSDDAGHPSSTLPSLNCLQILKTKKPPRKSLKRWKRICSNGSIEDLADYTCTVTNQVKTL